MAKRPRTNEEAPAERKVGQVVPFDGDVAEESRRELYAADYAKEIAARPSWLAIFAIDARSLGLFRVALGVWLLWDLFNRCFDLSAFYSDDGVLPRIARIGIYDLPEGSDRKYWLSFHMMCGDPWVIALFFGVAAFVYLHLLIGFRTRLFTLLSFLCACSLQSRNPAVLDGGDDLNRVLLFWSIFLPLGGRFSVDNWIGLAKAVPTKLLNLATFALLTQVGMVYLLGAYLKTDPAWRSDFTATWYTLHLECFTTAFGRMAAEWAGLLKAATFGTMLLEAFGPWLLLIPWRNDLIRLLILAGFWGFHIGIACTMHLGLFPLMGCIAWLPFLPGRVWENDRWPGRWFNRFRRTNPAFESQRMAGWKSFFLMHAGIGDYLRPRLGGKRMAFIAFCWIYVLIWNAREVHKDAIGKLLPAQFDIFGRLMRLDQNWKLFAPGPLKDDGWYVFRGTLEDGTQVNLWDYDKKLPMEKPDDFAALYRNTRWRKFLLNLWYDDYRPHRRALGFWLGNQWAAAHPGGSPLMKAEMIFMREETPPPGWAGKPIEPITLWPEQGKR